MKGERDTAIDFVKIIALFLVLNSHMGICYENYSFLATGGGIGDALFFFISGFTLFLGDKMRFIDWYKRRLSRIYPSLFAVAIIGALMFKQNDSFMNVVTAKRFWFIQCILVLYPFLYVVKNYVPKRQGLLCVLTVITISIFPFIYGGNGLLYSDGYYRWVVFFLFMLLGALVGVNRARIKSISIWLALLLTVLCTIAWYGSIMLLKDSWAHVFSIIPLLGTAYFVYCIGRSAPVERLFRSKIIGPVLISVGALCLESYLTQKLIITDRLNELFPWNIPIIVILVLLVSILAKVLAIMIRQVFSPASFEWQKLVKWY